MLLHVVVVEFIHHLTFEAMYSPQTIQSYRKRLGKFAMFWLDRGQNKDIETITVEDVLAYRKELIERKCKPSYICTITLVLRSFFRYCRTRGYHTIEPGQIRLPRVPRQEVAYLTREQVRTVLEAIDTTRKFGVQLMAMFQCLISSGMRISELISLNRDTIDFSTRSAEIVGKGSKKRLVVFSSDALEWVQKHLVGRSDNDQALFVAYCSNNGQGITRLNPDGVRHYLRKLSSKLGFKIYPHKLRRTAATTLHFNGMNTEMVRAFLGHENIATTSRYLGVNYEKLKEEHKKYMVY